MTILIKANYKTEHNKNNALKNKKQGARGTSS